MSRLTRRQFLKGVAMTTGAVGVATILPPGWFDLDAPLHSDEVTGLMPVRLFDGAGNQLAYGAATKRGSGWVTTFHPGDVRGHITTITYDLPGGGTLREPLSVRVTSADSIEFTLSVTATGKSGVVGIERALKVLS